MSDVSPRPSQSASPAEIMKPKIDLKDSRVQELIRIYGDRATTAYNVAMALEKAVHPIYVLPKYETLPQHLGSCVLFAIKDETFFLSAAHVFEPIGPYAVLVGCGDKLHALTGDRFSSKQGSSGTHGDDPVDAAVFHITCDVPNEIRSSAISLAHIDQDSLHHESEFHVAVGYRISKSTRSAGRLSSQRDMYPSCEYCPQKYDLVGLNRGTHVALTFEDEVLNNNTWQKAPVVRGMSGGAVFRISGLNSNPSATPPEVPIPRLTAIIIERRKKTRDVPPVLVGARIGFHLGLIDKYLPDLHLADLLAAERCVSAHGASPSNLQNAVLQATTSASQ